MTAKEESRGKKLLKELALPRQSAWERLAGDTRAKVFAFAEGYKNFISRAKTEREVVRLGPGVGSRPWFCIPGRPACRQGAQPGYPLLPGVAR